ncbi:MAG: hypothetical protein IJ494_01505 [Bacteroides sp.]|nr:hypothetical protein [Bacteroides sp.]
MKHKTSLLFFLFCCHITLLLAQERRGYDFTTYSDFVAENLDITFKKPKGFIDQNINKWIFYPELEHKRGGYAYASALQSKDEDCLIMYPVLEDGAVTLDDLRNTEWPFSQMKGELLDALGFDKNIKVPEADIKELQPYFRSLSSEEAKRLFNSDVAYISDHSLPIPYREVYTHVVGIYLGKAGRPVVFVKCFFTEKGKEKKDTFLKRLYKSIEYSNDAWTFDREKFIENQKRLRQQK